MEIRERELEMRVESPDKGSRISLALSVDLWFWKEEKRKHLYTYISRHSFQIVLLKKTKNILRDKINCSKAKNVSFEELYEESDVGGNLVLFILKKGFETTILKDFSRFWMNKNINLCSIRPNIIWKQTRL